MSFENHSRIVAIQPAGLNEVFAALTAMYGEPLPDGSRMVTTLGAFWDDAEQTRSRAASLTDGTITATPLADGRIAFRCRWQADLAAAFDAGHIAGAEELTEEQFLALQIPDEEPQP